MFTSLQARLWLTYAILILVILLIIALGVFVYLVRHPLVDRQSLQKLDVASRVIGRLYQGGNAGFQARQRLDLLGEQFSIRIVVYDQEGEEEYDSGGDAVDFNGSIIVRRSPSRGIIRDLESAAWLYNARNLPRGKTLLVVTPRQGGVSLLRSPQGREVLRDDLLPPFIRAGAVALTLAVLLAFWMSRWISAPIREITSAARRVARGEYQGISLQGPDEVRSLGLAFNDMIRKVRSSQESQRNFVANVSHELKTPLTSIQGFAQAILDGTVETRRGIKDSAGVIYHEAERMYRMVLDLLELARFDAGTVDLGRTEVDLEGLISRLVRNMSLRAEEQGLQLTLDLDPLPPYEGDPDRLAQVFSNIIDNALKYTPAGGMVRVSGERDQGGISIRVSDTGKGIPEAELPRVFDRFYQGERSRGNDRQPSSGLGLAIAQEIVQAHGGHISVDSTLGEGSEFEIRLPFPGRDGPEGERGSESRD